MELCGGVQSAVCRVGSLVKDSESLRQMRLHTPITLMTMSGYAQGSPRLSAWSLGHQ